MQYYSANTRITVVQKLVTENGTYYRTASAAKHGLNWAFEASAFGLPNEVAPSAPRQHPPKPTQPALSHTTGTKKQKIIQKEPAPKDGEKPAKKNFWRRLFRK